MVARNLEFIGPRLPPGVFSEQQNDEKGPSEHEPTSQVLEKQVALSTTIKMMSPIWKHAQPIGAGLYNLGNTCYMNSALQCLAYLPPLGTAALEGGLHGIGTCPRKGHMCTACLLQYQLRAMLTGSRVQAVRPQQFFSRLDLFNKSFANGQQEDSHEFLHCVLDAVERDTKLAYVALGGSKEQRTLIEDLFQGKFQSQVQCSACGYCSNTYESFCTLSLDIHGSTASVDESLRQFTLPEVLDGTNKYKCDRCKQLVKARKQLSIYDEPNILTVQLKRFDALNMGVKVTRHVRFTASLDLSPHSSEGIQTSSNGAANNPSGKSARYYLAGVLVHQGSSIHNGHYFSYVRDSKGGWWCTNDSGVSPATPQQVLSQQAYMLFYVRTKLKEPSPPAATSSHPRSSCQQSTAGEQVASWSHPAAMGPEDMGVEQSGVKIGPQLPPSSTNGNGAVHMQNGVSSHHGSTGSAALAGEPARPVGIASHLPSNRMGSLGISRPAHSSSLPSSRANSSSLSRAGSLSTSAHGSVGLGPASSLQPDDHHSERPAVTSFGGLNGRRQATFVLQSKSSESNQAHRLHSSTVPGGAFVASSASQPGVQHPHDQPQGSSAAPAATLLNGHAAAHGNGRDSQRAVQQGIIGVVNSSSESPSAQCSDRKRARPAELQEDSELTPTKKPALLQGAIDKVKATLFAGLRTSSYMSLIHRRVKQEQQQGRSLQQVLEDEGLRQECRRQMPKDQVPEVLQLLRSTVERVMSGVL